MGGLAVRYYGQLMLRSATLARLTLCGRMGLQMGEKDAYDEVQDQVTHH